MEKPTSCYELNCSYADGAPAIEFYSFELAEYLALFCSRVDDALVAYIEERHPEKSTRLLLNYSRTTGLAQPRKRRPEQPLGYEVDGQYWKALSCWRRFKSKLGSLFRR